MLGPKEFLLLARPGVPKDVLDNLPLFWAELSTAYARLDPNRTLESAEAPGYLSTSCNEWRVFVPWSLVKSFPGPKVLADLLETGRTVSLDPIVNICLSGSSAGLGSNIEIGDVDFCQYASIAPAQMINEAIKFRRENPPFLFKAQYGKAAEAEAPWENWATLTAAMSAVTSIEGSERFMLEFIGRTREHRNIPISTVVLASDFGSRDVGAARHSFMFQEAAAVPNGQSAPVWSLVDPVEISDFVRFLREQLSKYAHVNPIKALKRGLMLANTILLTDFADEALAILTSEACRQHVRKHRIGELERLYKHYQQENMAWSQEVVSNEEERILDTDGGSDSAGDLPSRCRDFVARLECAISDLESELEADFGAANDA
jgi:hypothetical protein